MAYNIMITSTRGIIVNKFKDKPMISIREFFNNKKGELQPGFKGIAMLPEHFNKLHSSINDIDDAIKSGNINTPIVSISKKQKVTISSYKGNTYVDLREFYEKEGETLPGKKGIALTLPQWELVKSNLPTVVEKVTELSV